MSLTEFLLARIAEDETVATAATNAGFGWRMADLAGGNEVWANRDAAGHDAFMVATTATRLNPNPSTRGFDDATHIARFDPARVLAECEAKRRIVEHCEVDHLALSPGDPYVLQLLALPYADHPDWREEWKP